MSRRNSNTDAVANTDLIIIGGGAAGMMAAAAAAESNLRCVVLERNNRPGRKLLMCGNNRCNLTTDLPQDKLIERYTPHNRDFLRAALTAFDSKALQRWFNDHGLRTVVKESGRVYPKTERASDVANCFKDIFRNNNLPLVLNCPVEEVSHTDALFRVSAPGMTLFSTYLLVTTGGVSYPKTGSVGDGQAFAKSFGHKLSPYRPGLVAYELLPCWLKQIGDLTLTKVRLTVLSGDTEFSVEGGLELRKGLVHGPAMIDASNVISRDNLKDVDVTIDLVPDMSAAELLETLLSGADLRQALSGAIPHDAIGIITKNVLKKAALPNELVGALKSMPLPVKCPRPLKEAMVTVGGIILDEIDPNTMQSRRCKGLYFAGEVLDVEGPCGGFNLQAAFATARLAVSAISASRPKRKYWE